MKNDTTYKQDLKIDPLSLDEELQWQPTLFEKWSRKYAIAAHTFDRKKEKLEVLYAELYEAVSISPEDYGVERNTEPALKQAILQLPAYRAAAKDMHTARKNMNILAGARDAMRYKKDALQELVRLFLSGYYSDPKIPHNAKEAFSKKQDEATHKQLSSSKRIKRLKRNKK